MNDGDGTTARRMRVAAVAVEFLTTLLRYTRFFGGYAGRRLLALVAISLVGSYAEAIGIALFFPILSPGADSGRLSASIARVVNILGLPAGVPGALLLVIGAFTIKGLFLFLGGAYQYGVSSDVTRRIRERIVSAIRRADFRCLLNTNAGHLTNVVTTEVSRTSSAFVYYSKVFPHLINIAIFFAIILVLEWRMTLLVAVAGAAVLLVVRIPAALSHRESRAVTGENSALSGLLVQTVHGARYLLSTGSFERLEKQIVGSTRRLAHSERRIGSLYSLSTALAQPLVVLLLACVLLYYSVVLRQGLAPALVLMMYLYRILTEIFAMQTDWQNFCSFTGGLEVVQGTIRHLEQRRDAVGGQQFEALRDGIELKDVTFAFDPGRPVLNHLDLRARRNQSIALVGESGAGKSTAIDVLTGLLKPQTGAVLVDGRDLAALDLDQFRRRIGYVPQDPILFDDTVANNISLWTDEPSALDALRRVRDAAHQAHCHDFIEALPEGYRSQVGDRGVKLSGGQRQRLAIARELFKRPDILILDEATSALDSESEVLIRESLDALRGTMTILVIAHRLSTVRSCDRIYVLDDGRVIEAGGFAELHARPNSRFRRMCDLQEVS